MWHAFVCVCAVHDERKSHSQACTNIVATNAPHATIASRRQRSVCVHAHTLVPLAGAWRDFFSINRRSHHTWCTHTITAVVFRCKPFRLSTTAIWHTQTHTCTHICLRSMLMHMQRFSFDRVVKLLIYLLRGLICLRSNYLSMKF